MTHFCRNCGTPLAELARFCGNCGVPLDREHGTPVLDARRLADTTSELRGAASAPPSDPHLVAAEARMPSGDPRLDAGPSGPSTRPIAAFGDWSALASVGRDRVRAWWSQPRHRTLMAIAACGVLLGAAIGLAFAAGGTIGSSGAPRARATPAPAKPNPPPAAADWRDRDYLTALEAILQQSATGRTQLVAALSGAQAGCAGPSLAASQQIESVVTNRSGVLARLAALPAPPNPEAHTLEVLLQEALQASVQADSQYETWTASLGRADPSDCADAAGNSDAVFRQARTADSTATTLKGQFVSAFNPVAARFGLPTWTQSQF